MTLKIGESKRFTLIQCKEDPKMPTAERFPVEVKYIKSVADSSSEGQSTYNKGALVEVTTWKLNTSTGIKTAVRSSFVIDQTDLPLIDNMPLSNGLRLALLYDYGSEVPGPRSYLNLPILALGFSSQSTMMKDKPSEQDYVNYLNQASGINPDSKRPTNSKDCKDLGPARSLAFVEPNPMDFQDKITISQ